MKSPIPSVPRLILLKICCCMFLTVLSPLAFSQITVLSSSLQPANLSPASIFELNILNNESVSLKAVLTGTLSTADSKLILTSTSNEINLPPGMISLNSGTVQVRAFEYSNLSIAKQIQAYQRLPAGAYILCIKITVNGELVEDWCDEIENSSISFISLINPYDEEVISTPNPMLSWHCSDYPLINSGNDFYEMVVVELRENQIIESAINENQPHFILTGLKEFQVLYPVVAKPLMGGKKYAWQVRRRQNGQIVEQTDVWQFQLEGNDPKSGTKYVALKKNMDAAYYVPIDNKIYFQFNEEYSGGQLNCRIFDWKNTELKPRVVNDKDNSVVGVKSNGDNRFEIDLMNLNVSKGYYTMIVENNKKEKFYLKFKMQ